MSRAVLLQDLALGAAEARPEAIAVVMGREALRYSALAQQSARLARALRGAGCVRGDRVALLMPKSPLQIVALLGVYQADAIAVPLDSASPAARLGKILQSCEPRILLAGGGVAARLNEILMEGGAAAGARIGWLDAPGDLPGVDCAFTAADVAALPPRAPARAATEEDAAHILYTSGSTGDPKGVVIPHRSVLRFVDWAVRHFAIAEGERLSGHSPLHFDLSTFDTFGAFAARAELHLVPPYLSLLPHRLADLIRASRLTQWFSVPSLMNQMARLDVVRQGDFPELRRMLWCGEVFPTPSLRHFMQRLPHVAFANLYGPTETTIASSYHDVAACPEDERAPVPIGRACAGEELIVLDERMRPAAVGEVGELHIGGDGLALGYWRDPARTAEAFVRVAGGDGQTRTLYRTGDLAFVDGDGRVHLVGRRDSQIKSRGYRIELGEIESAIAVTGLAEEAVVAAIATDGFEGNAIACAYVPAPGRDAPPAALLRELRRLLPGYMLPSRLVPCVRLPRNGNGKLDRKLVRDLLARETHGRQGHAGAGHEDPLHP